VSIAEALQAHCGTLNIPFDPTWVNPVTTHLRLLERWSKRMNITSISRPEDAVVRHIIDSLSLLKLSEVRDLQGAAIDVGSGGGFPGIPLAMALPQVQWTLMEPRTKRGVFLERVIAEAGLKNVTWSKGRVPEDAAPGAFDCVVSRATLPPAQLLEASRPMLADAGVTVLMTATRPDDLSGWEVLQEEAFELAGAHRWIAAVSPKP